MQIIITQAVGAVVFLAGSIWLGRTTRRLADTDVAERASRISHLLFWVALVLPGMVGLFYPGLAAYDALLGVPRLPYRSLWVGVGLVLLGVGLGLVVVSNRALIKLGKGSAAFLLTEELVADGVYGRSRNPMSLGFYVVCAGVGLIAGSLSVTLGVLLVILPVHIFNLWYFEERELEIRYGRPYVEYKRRVPFLFPRLG
jgi:protein-S-isoprenylcysteine O-methyltransferase Ste14